MEYQLEVLKKEIERCKQNFPTSQELLEFYFAVLEIQHNYYNHKIKPHYVFNKYKWDSKIKSGKFILDGAPLGISSEIFNALKSELEKVLADAKGLDVENSKDFILYNAAAPFFRKEANQNKFDYNGWTKGVCPFCGAYPQIGKLDKDDGREILHCSICWTEWRFKRLQCPFCGNVDTRDLQYFYVGENRNLRVYSCEKCKRYIKIVDERDPKTSVVLPIQNIITLDLDAIAQKEGYKQNSEVKENSKIFFDLV